MFAYRFLLCIIFSAVCSDALWAQIRRGPPANTALGDHPEDPEVIERYSPYLWLPDNSIFIEETRDYALLMDVCTRTRARVSLVHFKDASFEVKNDEYFRGLIMNTIFPRAVQACGGQLGRIEVLNFIFGYRIRGGVTSTKQGPLVVQISRENDPFAGEHNVPISKVEYFATPQRVTWGRSNIRFIWDVETPGGRYFGTNHGFTQGDASIPPTGLFSINALKAATGRFQEEAREADERKRNALAQLRSGEDGWVFAEGPLEEWRAYTIRYQEGVAFRTEVTCFERDPFKRVFVGIVFDNTSTAEEEGEIENAWLNKTGSAIDVEYLADGAVRKMTASLNLEAPGRIFVNDLYIGVVDTGSLRFRSNGNNLDFVMDMAEISRINQYVAAGHGYLESSGVEGYDTFRLRAGYDSGGTIGIYTTPDLGPASGIYRAVKNVCYPEAGR